MPQRLDLSGLRRSFHLLGSPLEQGSPDVRGRSFDRVRQSPSLDTIVGFDRVPQGFDLNRHVFQKALNDGRGQLRIPHEPIHQVRFAEHIGVRFTVSDRRCRFSFGSRGRRVFLKRLGKPAIEHLQHGLVPNWLGKVVTHAGPDALLPVIGGGICRQSDDRYFVTADPGLGIADDSGRPITIHFGHLAVHEDQVIVLALQGPQRLQAIRHHVGLVPELR